MARPKIYTGTIRVYPKHEEDVDEEERAMDFEYSDQDHALFVSYLKLKGVEFKWEGNAFSIRTKNEDDIKLFRDIVKLKYPKENIKIDKGYWLED